MKHKIVIIILSLFFAVACSENSTETQTDNFSFSFAVDNSLPKSAANDISLTSVKILVRDLKLKYLASEDTSNVRTGIFVVDLNIDGEVTEVSRLNISQGTYESAKFEIHKLEPTEELPDSDFVGDKSSYSVIVKGTYQGTEFVYKSQKSAHQHVKFDEPIEITDGDELNVSLVVDPNSWFQKDGQTLNPMDVQNENDIDNIIKDSFIRAFRDRNRDGMPD
mgnify:CR=1 FL=1